MFRFLLIVTALAYVSAGVKDCCSVEDRAEVLSLWEKVWSAQYTGRRVKLSQQIFNRMFEMNADLRGLFSRVGGDDLESAAFRAHAVRVANGLDNCINLATDPASLEKQLEHYGKKHATYEGFKGEYFRYFIDASNDILPQAIPCFNKAAWTRCLEHFTERMVYYMG